MATVGSVLINFSAATAGYFAGSKSVRDDASGFPSYFGGIASSLTGVFAGIGAGLSAGALVDGLKNAGEQVTELAHDADRLSVSTEQLSRLRFASEQVGVSGESLNRAMLKAEETIGKAATEGGEAAGKLQEFGFNVQELVAMKPGDEFATIADKIASISNPAQRAAAEVAIFGKSGAELKPLLEQGAGGLARMAEEADRLGITMSSVDAEQTLKASQAVNKVQEAITGVAQHIAADLAPYVEDVANKMLAWAETGGRVGQIVSGAITAIEYTAAGLLTTWDLIQGGVEIMGGVGVAAFATLTKGITLAADAGAWLSNHIFGTHFDTSGIDQAADHFAAISKAMMDEGANTISDAFSGKSGAKVFEYFDDVSAKAHAAAAAAVAAHQQFSNALEVPDTASKNADKITEAIANLHKEVDEFGLSEGAKKLADLKLLGATAEQQAEAATLADQLDKMKAQADVAKELDALKKESQRAGLDDAQKKVADLQDKGATADQIAQAQQYQQQIEAITAAKEESKRLDEEAKKVIENGLTPLDKEREKLAELQKLYESGRLTKEQYAAAAQREAEKVQGEERTTQAAATRNSAAGFKLIDEINRRVHGGGGTKSEQLLAQILRELAKGNKTSDKIAGHTAPKALHHQRLAVA